MNTNKQGRAPTYDNAFKIAIAREYLSSNLGYGALAKKYNLPEAKTVDWFVKWYKRNYSEDLQEQAKPESITADLNNNTQLSTQLKEANLKIAGLEILIATARKELGIDIVKKYGTKQSTK